MHKIFKDYTSSIIILLLITTFSGSLRKWANLPNVINNIFLLIIMVFPCYLLFIYKDDRTEVLNKTLKNSLKIWLFILLILAIHPLNLTYFHGIFGFLLNLTFIGILLSYLKNKKKFDDKKIIKLVFLLLITQLIVATVQYNSPKDSFINVYADNRIEQGEDQTNENEFVQASAMVGDAVRVTGTFSYLGGYTAAVTLFLLFTLYLTKAKNTKYLIYLSPLIIYAALLSGSRGNVAFVLIMLASFTIIERKILFKNPRPIFLTSLGFIVILSINISTGDKFGLIEKSNTAYQNFMVRVEANQNESDGRLTNDITQLFFRDFDYRYTGVGLGSTYQGANALFGKSRIIEQTPVEGEQFRLLVEGGIFFVIIRLLIIIIIFTYLDLPIALKAILFLLCCIFSQNVFHIYNATYYAIGIILLNQAYIKDKNESHSLPLG